MRTVALVILVGIITPLFLSTCAKNPVTGKREFMLVSKKQEAQMGAQSDPQIVAFFGIYNDQKLQDFIDRKGEEMVKVSHRSNLDFTFRIVDSPVINAFAVPGGYVYFTRGIMAHFNNEAEFAGVLGHEIGHVTARHSAQQQSKSMLAQVGLLVGVAVSQTFSQFADLAGQGVSLLFLKFGRDDENEADKLGVEYSSKVGYNAHEMADFFNMLQRKEEMAGGQSIPTFLSTHPHPADRFENVHNLAEKWQDKLNLENPEIGRNNYLKMIDGIVYGEDPRQGYNENNVFYHPVLKFYFPIPEGWIYQNTPQQVQMAPQNGEALMSLTLAPGESLQTAAQQMLENYNLTLVESRNVKVNGLNAIALVADQQQEGGTIRVMAYLISHGNNIYNLMGVSALQNFNNYLPVFSNTMEKFGPLTDQSKINVSPERIKIVTVPSTMTMTKALQHFNMAQNRMEEISILNSIGLNDEVPQGTLIKVLGK